METLRDYGRRRLADTGEFEWLQERLLQQELALAKTAAGHLTGRDQQHWMRVIAAEIDNIRSVLAWGCNAGHSTAALELVVSLLKYWEVHGVTEGRETVEQLLASDRTLAGDGLPSSRRKAMTCTFGSRIALRAAECRGDTIHHLHAGRCIILMCS